jgi:hypothetical protein
MGCRASHRCVAASGVCGRRCAEARYLLEPIYGWFTEGFEKALLDELGGTRWT